MTRLDICFFVDINFDEERATEPKYMYKRATKPGYMYNEILPTIIERLRNVQFNNF